MKTIIALCAAFLTLSALDTCARVRLAKIQARAHAEMARKLDALLAADARHAAAHARMQKDLDELFR